MDEFELHISKAKTFQESGALAEAIEEYESAWKLDSARIELAELVECRVRAGQAERAAISGEILARNLSASEDIGLTSLERQIAYQTILEALAQIDCGEDQPRLQYRLGEAFFHLSCSVGKSDDDVFGLRKRASDFAEQNGWGTNRQATFFLYNLAFHFAMDDEFDPDDREEAYGNLKFWAENEDSGAYFYLGLIDNLRGEEKEAEVHWEKLPPDDYHFPEAMRTLAESYEYQGWNWIALQYYEQIPGEGGEIDCIRCETKARLQDLEGFENEALKKTISEIDKLLSGPGTYGTESESVEVNDNNPRGETEDLARFVAQQSQNLFVGIKGEIEQVLKVVKQEGLLTRESSTNRHEETRKESEEKVHAVGTQVARGLERNLPSRMSITDVLSKILTCWPTLLEASSRDLIEAERNLNYPLCMELDDFSAAVGRYSKLLERDLEARIYVPICSEAKTRGIPSGDFAMHFRYYGKPSFTPHAFSQALLCSSIDELCKTFPKLRSKNQRSEISSVLEMITSVRSRAEHNANPEPVTFLEALEIRQKTFWILENV